eukprot:jgi/Mesvir1/16482/Mv10040-RA.1
MAGTALLGSCVSASAVAVKADTFTRGAQVTSRRLGRHCPIGLGHGVSLNAGRSCASRPGSLQVVARAGAKAFGIDIQELDKSQMDEMLEMHEKGKPVEWNTMFRYLMGPGAKVQAITPQAAWERSRKKTITILDVRSADDGASDIPWMNRGFFVPGTMRYGVIANSVNIPLFQTIQGLTMWRWMRRAAFTYIMGVLNGQEVRPTFSAEVEAAIPNKATPIALLCDSGGNLDANVNRKFGLMSRSLQAAFYLKLAGYTNLYYIKGGFRDYVREDLPVEEFVDENAQPFAQKNFPRMFALIGFIVLATLTKYGIIFFPLLIGLGDPSKLSGQ